MLLHLVRSGDQDDSRIAVELREGAQQGCVAFRRPGLAQQRLQFAAEDRRPSFHRDWQPGRDLFHGWHLGVQNGIGLGKVRVLAANVEAQSTDGRARSEGSTSSADLVDDRVGDIDKCGLDSV